MPRILIKFVAILLIPCLALSSVEGLAAGPTTVAAGHSFIHSVPLAAVQSAPAFNEDLLQEEALVTVSTWFANLYWFVKARTWGAKEALRQASERIQQDPALPYGLVPSSSWGWVYQTIPDWWAFRWIHRLIRDWFAPSAETKKHLYNPARELVYKLRKGAGSKWVPVEDAINLLREHLQIVPPEEEDLDREKVLRDLLKRYFRDPIMGLHGVAFFGTETTPRPIDEVPGAREKLERAIDWFAEPFAQAIYDALRLMTPMESVLREFENATNSAFLRHQEYNREAAVSGSPVAIGNKGKEVSRQPAGRSEQPAYDSVAEAIRSQRATWQQKYPRRAWTVREVREEGGFNVGNAYLSRVMKSLAEEPGSGVRAAPRKEKEVRYYLDESPAEFASRNIVDAGRQRARVDFSKWSKEDLDHLGGLKGKEKTKDIVERVELIIRVDPSIQREHFGPPEAWKYLWNHLRRMKSRRFGSETPWFEESLHEMSRAMGGIHPFKLRTGFDPEEYRPTLLEEVKTMSRAERLRRIRYWKGLLRQEAAGQRSATMIRDIEEGVTDTFADPGVWRELSAKFDDPDIDEYVLIAGCKYRPAMDSRTPYQRIALLSEAKGWRLAELARRSRLDETMLKALMLGQTVQGPGVWKKLAETFAVPFEDLVGVEASRTAAEADRATRPQRGRGFAYPMTLGDVRPLLKILATECGAAAQAGELTRPRLIETYYASQPLFSALSPQSVRNHIDFLVKQGILEPAGRIRRVQSYRITGRGRLEAQRVLVSELVGRLRDCLDEVRHKKESLTNGQLSDQQRDEVGALTLRITAMLSPYLASGKIPKVFERHIIELAELDRTNAYTAKQGLADFERHLATLIAKLEKGVTPRGMERKSPTAEVVQPAKLVSQDRLRVLEDWRKSLEQLHQSLGGDSDLQLNRLESRTKLEPGSSDVANQVNEIRGILAQAEMDVMKFLKAMARRPGRKPEEIIVAARTHLHDLLGAPDPPQELLRFAKMIRKRVEQLLSRLRAQADSAAGGGEGEKPPNTPTFYGTPGSYDPDYGLTIAGKRVSFAEASAVLLPKLMQRRSTHVLKLTADGQTLEVIRGRNAGKDEVIEALRKSLAGLDRPEAKECYFYLVDGREKCQSYPKFGNDPYSLLDDSSGEAVYAAAWASNGEPNVYLTQEFVRAVHLGGRLRGILAEELTHAYDEAAGKHTTEGWDPAKKPAIREAQNELAAARLLGQVNASSPNPNLEPSDPRVPDPRDWGIAPLSRDSLDQLREFRRGDLQRSTKRLSPAESRALDLRIESILRRGNGFVLVGYKQINGERKMVGSCTVDVGKPGEAEIVELAVDRDRIDKTSRLPGALLEEAIRRSFRDLGATKIVMANWTSSGSLSTLPYRLGFKKRRGEPFELTRGQGPQSGGAAGMSREKGGPGRTGSSGEAQFFDAAGQRRHVWNLAAASAVHAALGVVFLWWGFHTAVWAQIILFVATFLLAWRALKYLRLIPGAVRHSRHAQEAELQAKTVGPAGRRFTQYYAVSGKRLPDAESILNRAGSLLQRAWVEELDRRRFHAQTGFASDRGRPSTNGLADTIATKKVNEWILFHAEVAFEEVHHQLGEEDFDAKIHAAYDTQMWWAQVSRSPLLSKRREELIKLLSATIDGGLTKDDLYKLIGTYFTSEGGPSDGMDSGGPAGVLPESRAGYPSRSHGQGSIRFGAYLVLLALLGISPKWMNEPGLELARAWWAGQGSAIRPGLVAFLHSPLQSPWVWGAGTILVIGALALWEVLSSSRRGPRASWENIRNVTLTLAVALSVIVAAIALRKPLAQYLFGIGSGPVPTPQTGVSSLGWIPGTRTLEYVLAGLSILWGWIRRDVLIAIGRAIVSWIRHFFSNHDDGDRGTGSSGGRGRGLFTAIGAWCTAAGADKKNPSNRRERRRLQWAA